MPPGTPASVPLVRVTIFYTGLSWWVADMIIALLLALVAVLAVGEFLLLGALTEAYREMRQLRQHSGMLDNAAPVDLGQVRDALASEVGLDAGLDRAAIATVVYLNDRCGTCRAIVGSLNGVIPDGMWLVVIADTADDGYVWLATGGIDRNSIEAQRVMVMPPDEVERRLGMLVTPLVIEIENGRLDRAKTIPSIRQFYALASSAPTLIPAVEKEAAS